MPHRPAAEAVLEHLPAGVVVLDDEGRLAGGNTAAQRLLGALPRDGSAGCCELVGCRRPGTPLESRCISEAVRASGRPVGELLVQTPGGGAWVTAAPVDGGGIVLQLRTEAGSAVAADERLRIRALGPMQLEAGGAVLEGDWLAHRPGQVLKYLVAARGRAVAADELLTAFWPQADGTPAATNVRQAVHALRDRMEPGRARQTASRRVRRRRSRARRRSTAATSSPTSPTPSGRCPSAPACARSPGACCARSRGCACARASSMPPARSCSGWPSSSRSTSRPSASC